MLLNKAEKLNIKKQYSCPPNCDNSDKEGCKACKGYSKAVKKSYYRMMRHYRKTLIKKARKFQPYDYGFFMEGLCTMLAWMETELYRAKRVDNNEWVYGPYAFYASNKGLKRAIYTGTALGCVIPVEVIPDTVGRCTGIRDANDTLIYKGDILEISYDDDTAYTTEVRAYGSTLCVDVEGEDYDFTAIDFAVDIWKDNCCDWKVIGNVYDKQEE